MNEDCIFCKIITKQVPGEIFYEDDNVVAFMDAFPTIEGHSIVIPKKHTESLRTSQREILQVAEVLPRLAKAVVEGVGATGINILCNDGSAAGQVIPHVHFHLIPRHENDGFRFLPPQRKVGAEELHTLAEEFRSRLTEE